MKRTKNKQIKKPKKGITQVDYIVAAGMFIVVFALLVQFTLSYFATTSEIAASLDLNSDGRSLLTVADHEHVPAGWPELQDESGLVLLMHFNNETKYNENRTYFHDFSSQGNHGNCSGACPYYNQSGKLGGAMMFDGIDNYVEIGGSINLNGNFSVEAWVKRAAICSNCVDSIIALGTGESNSAYYQQYLVELDHSTSNNQVVFTMGNSTKNGYYHKHHLATGTNASVADTEWHHVAVTLSGTTSRAYVDGVEMSNHTQGDGTRLTSGLIDHRIGSRAAGGNYFNGTIDEVAIYNRTLSAAEIMNHYNYGKRIKRIGLESAAYRFLIVVNNTQPFYYNQSQSVGALTNELVTFNYTDIGHTKIDYKSTSIYDEDNNTVQYQIDGNNITFRTDLNANQAKWFTVYFDDDSIFEDRSTAIAGSNTISETLYPVEKIKILQYRKIMDLNQSNYSSVKNMSAIDSDFRIRIYDTESLSYFKTFGDNPPRRGNIIAFQRFALFQNSTAGIRKGKVFVQVW